MNQAPNTWMHQSSSVDKDWWRGAVIYQIYPRSYQDSTGDGVGDLAGITARLPHIADLGADAVWISPFFTSPMLDFGYDVSDYCDVDPMFGTLADFDALVARAHGLGLKVMIDLVLSHTSDQHPWFQDSAQSRSGEKSDWYVWADAKPDGTPPNNWLSIFGGSAWEWSGERMQYYLHNFLKEQPDLNLHNPAVQQELLDVARFWLDRGVDGFRLDTINFYFHDLQLRDNPALAPDERNAVIAPEVNPYNWQDHRFDKNQPENLEFLRKLRALMDEYPAVTAVGEVGDAQYGLKIQSEYTSGNDKVHMCYSFEFLSSIQPDAARISQVLTDYENESVDGWACWAFSNHDVVRHRSRWGLSDAAQRVMISLLLSLRGTACIYQGEELGLTEADIAFEDLQDPYGIQFWPKFKGRDGCRTPMPWQRDNANAGFSDSKPWLPVSAEHLSLAASEQTARADSLYSYYKAAIAYRKAHKALQLGALTELSTSGEAVGFTRNHGEASIYSAFNLGDRELRIDLPSGNWTIDNSAPQTSNKSARIENHQMILPPYAVGYAQKS